MFLLAERETPSPQRRKRRHVRQRRQQEGRGQRDARQQHGCHRVPVAGDAPRRDALLLLLGESSAVPLRRRRPALQPGSGDPPVLRPRAAGRGPGPQLQGHLPRHLAAGLGPRDASQRQRQHDPRLLKRRRGQDAPPEGPRPVQEQPQGLAREALVRGSTSGVPQPHQEPTDDSARETLRGLRQPAGPETPEQRFADAPRRSAGGAVSLLEGAGPRQQQPDFVAQRHLRQVLQPARGRPFRQPANLLAHRRGAGPGRRRLAAAEGQPLVLRLQAAASQVPAAGQGPGHGPLPGTDAAQGRPRRRLRPRQRTLRGRGQSRQAQQELLQPHGQVLDAQEAHHRGRHRHVLHLRRLLRGGRARHALVPQVEDE